MGDGKVRRVLVVLEGRNKEVGGAGGGRCPVDPVEELMVTDLLRLCVDNVIGWRVLTAVVVQMVAENCLAGV